MIAVDYLLLHEINVWTVGYLKPYALLECDNISSSNRTFFCKKGLKIIDIINECLPHMCP